MTDCSNYRTGLKSSKKKVDNILSSVWDVKEHTGPVTVAVNEKAEKFLLFYM